MASGGEDEDDDAVNALDRGNAEGLYKHTREEIENKYMVE
jgi:hypothetical protein